MTKRKRQQKFLKAKIDINDNIYIVDYTTYKHESKKILTGLVLRALRKIKKAYLHKGMKYKIEIEILEFLKRDE